MNSLEKECDIFILGVSGMLGNSLLRYFKKINKYKVIGSIRGSKTPEKLNSCDEFIIKKLDVSDERLLKKTIYKYQPKIVINCIGLVKQVDSSTDPIQAIQINSLLPHRLLSICESINSKLVHISTDCVFSGVEGNYKEGDTANATDVYGLSKRLGEIDAPNLTLRTSVIGREIKDHVGLLDWFLSQEKDVLGYSGAIFSGLPAPEIAAVLRDFVIPNKSLAGLYHLAANPISKYELLKLIANEYGLTTHVVKDSTFKIDRSLNAEKFNSETGYTPPTWQALVRQMHKFGEAYA